MPAFQVITVPQLLRYIKSLMDEKKILSDLVVSGEISDLSVHRATGHIYFFLGSGDCRVKCVMFSRYAQKLRVLPEDGASVMVRGSASLYERDGAFELLVYEIQELGGGAKAQSLDELKARLAGEGLFDEQRKHPVKTFPVHVGIITSREGAALHDITKTFATWNPTVKLALYHASVQGLRAPAEIISAIDAAEADGDCDCLIIARGGGSSDDLSCFNDEGLVRRVAACRIPVVSAVGHETDYTFTDMAADVRAATPTAACRAASGSSEQLLYRLESLTDQLYMRTNMHIKASESRYQSTFSAFSALSPQAILKKNRQNLEYLIILLLDSQTARLTGMEQHLKQYVSLLDSLNPARLLSRGYTITLHEGKAVTGVAGLEKGSVMVTITSDGKITSFVTSTEHTGEK